MEIVLRVASSFEEADNLDLDDIARMTPAERNWRGFFEALVAARVEFVDIGAGVGRAR